MPRTKKSSSGWPESVSRDYYELRMKGMPAGAIKADPAKHAAHNSYNPPLWYVDEKKRCVGCGKEFTFTAREQQHWFEVLKIPIYVTANRCSACRGERRNQIAGQKRHMADMAKRPRHPNEEFIRKRAK